MGRLRIVGRISRLCRCFQTRLFLFVRRRVLSLGKTFGFVNINYHLIHGPSERLHLHPTVNPTNTLFNTRSGEIHVGKNTFFGHNCMVLTGIHLFENGKLKEPKSEQVPTSGYDIHIGSGCWITSGAIVLGGVHIGDNCLIMAGAVVADDIPSGSVAGGVPAAVVEKSEEIKVNTRIKPES